MSTRQDLGESPPIESRDDLVRWIADGEKPRERWRIGTEHEKFVFHDDTLTPVPYAGPRSILALMSGMMERFGWEAIREGETIIALKRPGASGSEAISLEPGGQFELSGAPLATLHETSAELQEHRRQVQEIGRELGLSFLGMGFTPNWRLDEMPTMPKRRYAVMTNYMPKVGTRGLDMMYRTTTVQVNLDFGSEADMVAKLRVALALQPIATALFATSPFAEGKPNGLQSARSEIWRDTDRARTGMLPFVFEPGMGYARYVEYALDVPMYFVYRDGHYIDVAGASFRDFLAGKLAALPGQRPTIDDWSDHLTTLFPEVRLKRFLETRGADSGRAQNIVALPAFFVGLLYDDTALAAASELVRDWTAEERQQLRDQVPRLGLATPFRKGRLLDQARQAVAIARTGLANRRKLDAAGRDETRHLEFAETVAARGKSEADLLLENYNGAWSGSVTPIYRTYKF